MHKRADTAINTAPDFSYINPDIQTYSGPDTVYVAKNDSACDIFQSVSCVSCTKVSDKCIVFPYLDINSSNQFTVPQLSLKLNIIPLP